MWGAIIGDIAGSIYEFKQLKGIKPITCKETIDNCLYALFTSSSFEGSIKRVISYGGDTDTNACIVGAMAEAMYGVNPILIERAKCKIPKEFIDILEKGYKTKKMEDIER